MSKTKKNSLGILLLLLILSGVLVFFLVNRGDFGQARISGQIMQYKSATAGGACVIDANCIEGLRCLNNICTAWTPPEYIPESMSISGDPKDDVDLFEDITFSITLSPTPPADYDFSGWSGKWYFTCDYQDSDKQRSVAGADVIADQIYVYLNCAGSSNRQPIPPCVQRIRYELYYNGAEINFAETNIGLLSQSLPWPCGG